MTLDPTAAHQAIDALVAQANTQQAQAVAAQQQADAAAQQQAVAAQKAADQVTIDQQAALIAELEAELNPPPPPPPDAVRWGINATSKAQHDTQLALFGPEPLVFRYYQNPGEAIAWPVEYTLRPGDCFVYSDKVLPHTKKVADLVALFQKAPADRPFIYCPWHEPEDDITAGKFTAAQLAQGFALARQARDQAGTKNVYIAAILMGYTWQKGSGRNPELYLPADTDFDMITTDTYFDGPIGVPIANIPTIWDPQLATAAAHGKTWGITETGVGQKVSGQTRLDAVTLLAKTIKGKLLGQKARTGPLVGLWFNVPGSTAAPGQWALDATGVKAWKAGQAA